jgi:hypothetical protein
MFVIHPHKKFHISISNSSWFVAIKLKSEENFAQLSCYTIIYCHLSFRDPKVSVATKLALSLMGEM